MSITGCNTSIVSLDDIGINVILTTKSNSIFSLLSPTHWWFNAYAFGVFVTIHGVKRLVTNYMYGRYKRYSIKDCIFNLDTMLAVLGPMLVYVHYKKLQEYL